MRISTTLRTGTMWLAILGMFLPNTSFGASPTPVAAAEIQDVALHPDRSLHGVVTDVEGQVYANIPVQVFQAGAEVGRATTDVEGRFVVHHLKGGACSVEYPGQVVHYRVWTHNAAPPNACHHIRHPVVCAVKALACAVCGCHHHGCACHAQSGNVCKHHQHGCTCVACADHQHAYCQNCGCHGRNCNCNCHRHRVLGKAFGGLLTSPIGLAAIAASIAVPLTLNDNDDDVNAS